MGLLKVNGQQSTDNRQQVLVIRGSATLLTARCSLLIASNALGIGAASFASETGTSFGDGDEVTEPVEVPSPYLERARRKHSEQRYSGKPDGFAGTPKELKA